MSQIKELPISSIIPYVNNARNNENAIDKVAGSIAEFGFQSPIIIDKDNVIIAGHTRLAAAKKIGLKKVPVIVADKLTTAQVKAFRIADNKTAELSTWNNDVLKLELEQLKELDLDLKITGMEQFEIDSFLSDISDEDLERLFSPVDKNGKRKHWITCPECGAKFEK